MRPLATKCRLAEATLSQWSDGSGGEVSFFYPFPDKKENLNILTTATIIRPSCTIQPTIHKLFINNVN